jgi:hypothetical protein
MYSRDTIELASRVFCDILAANIGIVRKTCVVPSDKVCLDRFASVDGQAPDIVQGFSGVGPRERLACQEITLLEGAIRFTGPHAVTGRSSQPGKTNRIARPHVSAQHGTLFEHCACAPDRSLAVGSHDLPLIGTGDWDDGMNQIGQGGKGARVWRGTLRAERGTRRVRLLSSARSSHDSNICRKNATEEAGR